MIHRIIFLETFFLRYLFLRETAASAKGSRTSKRGLHGIAGYLRPSCFLKNVEKSLLYYSIFSRFSRKIMKGVLATIVSGHISFGTASINLALEKKSNVCWFMLHAWESGKKVSSIEIIALMFQAWQKAQVNGLPLSGTKYTQLKVRRPKKRCFGPLSAINLSHENWLGQRKWTALNSVLKEFQCLNPGSMM